MRPNLSQFNSKSLKPLKMVISTPSCSKPVGFSFDFYFFKKKK